MNNSNLILSVIICTYRRPDRLRFALESLTKQTWQGSGWEVFVVENDNKPLSEIAVVVRDFETKIPLRWCFEKVPNLSRARNLGARMAYGKYLAYLDDDAEATDKWLASLIEGFSRFEPDICGGPSYPLFRSPKPYWFPEEIETSYMFGSEFRALKCGEMLGGMNFVIRRDLLLSLGGFREYLGMAGDKIAFGEETRVMMDAWEANPNLKVQYLPNAIVLHEVRPEKMTIQWQIRFWFVRGWDAGLLETGRHCWRQTIWFFLSNMYWFLRRFPVFIAVLFWDLFHPGRTMWRRFLMDQMYGTISKNPLRFYLGCRPKLEDS